MNHAGLRRAPLAKAATLAIAQALALGTGAVVTVGVAHAQASSPQPISIAAQPLADALNAWARQTKLQVVVQQSLVAGRQAPAVNGSLSPREALDRLLAGSGLVAAPEGTAFVVKPAPAATGSPGAAGRNALPPVLVRGGRERGDGLPAAYAGGSVARGGRIGIMGNGDMMDTPMNIVAFTSAFREDIQALSVSDMLRYGVSAQTPQAGAVPTTDVLYARGFNVGSYDGTFDGMPGLLGRMPPVEAIERVELLLGANAFTNGQPASTGGNINVVPKRAGDTPFARLSLQARTASILGVHADVGRRFGTDNAFGLRANLAYSDGDTELQSGRRRANARALAFDFRSPTLRATVDYMGNDRRLPAETWFVINPDVAMPDAKRASRDFRQPWTFYKDEWDVVAGRVEWEFAPRWNASVAYGRMWNRVERFSQVNEIIDNAGNMQDAWGGTLGHSRQRRMVDSVEASVGGEFATGPVTHRVRLGAGRWGEKSRYAGSYADEFVPFASNIYAPVHYATPSLGLPALAPGYDSRTRNTSLFVGDEIRALDDRLRVTLGARRVQYLSESLDGNTGAWSGDPAKKRWSPAYAVLFKPQPWLSLYANRLEALESGFRVSEPAMNAGEVLPPLPADQTEVGAKFDLGRVGGGIALFEIDKPSYFTGTDGYLRANGRQVNRGVELSLFGEPSPGLRLYSSASWIDPRMKRTPDGAYDGKLAVSASRVMANAHLDWDVPGLQGLALLAGLSHAGALFNDEANTQRLKGWTRVDAGLRYRTQLGGRPTVFRLNVDNLLDRKYFVSERGTIYLAPKRTVAASASIDF